LQVQFNPNEKGAFGFWDDNYYKYRYYRVGINDMFNLNGPQFSIGNIYIGNYVSTSLNLTNGFQSSLYDPTVSSETDSGALYFDEKYKYNVLSSIQFGILKKEDKDKIYNIYEKNGKSVPFYISVDPLTGVSTNLSDLTKFVYFNESPIFSHLLFEYYSTSLSMREVIWVVMNSQISNA